MGSKSAETLVQNLQKDCSIEDVQYGMFVINKVCRGEERLAAEGGVSQEEAEKRLSKWIIR